jgi:hypothetical protein
MEVDAKVLYECALMELLEVEKKMLEYKALFVECHKELMEIKEKLNKEDNEK